MGKSRASNPQHDAISRGVSEILPVVAALAHAEGAVDSSCLPYAALQQPCIAENVCEQRINITATAAWAGQFSMEESY